MPLLFFTGVFLISGFVLPDIGVRCSRAAMADHLVINEIFIDSIIGTGGSDDDWVELYNPTDDPVIIDGWSLQKFAAAGTSINNQPLSGTVNPKSYFLIVRDGAATSQTLKDSADLLVSDSFSLAANNIIYLVRDAANIVPSSGSASIVDLVGFGSAQYYESGPSINIAETKSISRSPDGNDSDNNTADFILLNMPTPTNSTTNNNQNISGNVLLTITPATEAVQNISPTSADVVFQVNSAGTALVNYGLSNTYSQASLPETVIENTNQSISLTGLQCGKTYHYSIYAENEDASLSDNSADAIFTTLPCGITIDSLVMTRSAAKANNKYDDGWAWEFNITIWDLGETSLKMKFGTWNGPATLDAGGNMEYSADNGQFWQSISTNNSYPAAAIDLTGKDISSDQGRQIKLIVRMKVPVGSRAGTYNSNYGILTE